MQDTSVDIARKANCSKQYVSAIIKKKRKNPKIQKIIAKKQANPSLKSGWRGRNKAAFEQKIPIPGQTSEAMLGSISSLPGIGHRIKEFKMRQVHELAI